MPVIVRFEIEKSAIVAMYIWSMDVYVDVRSIDFNDQASISGSMLLLSFTTVTKIAFYRQHSKKYAIIVIRVQCMTRGLPRTAGHKVVISTS